MHCKVTSSLSDAHNQICDDACTHRVPLLGEVISIMDEEVTPIHMDEGPQGQVLGPVALLPHQLLARVCHMEVLHRCFAFSNLHSCRQRILHTACL